MKTTCKCGTNLEWDQNMAGETVPCENCGALVMLRRCPTDQR